jgi:hypothetical protein
MSEELKSNASVDGVKEPDKSNAATSMTVDIDGQQKSYTPDDIKNLVAQQASATQKTQDVADVLKLAAKHEIPVKEFANQIEGLFGRVSELMEKGIIDDNGELIAQAPAIQAPVIPENPLPDFGNMTPQNTQATADSKLEQVVQAALKPMRDEVAKVKEENVRIKENSAMFLKSQVRGEIQKAHSELSDQDADYIIERSLNDTSIKLEEHIEKYKTTKKDYGISQAKFYAKEFGLVKDGADFDKWNENRLREQDSKGGGFAGLFKGKKFSFKKGEGSVTPRQAMEGSLKTNIGG